jgi:tRNA A37 threonylcarbamoyladenosine synthetase subunit TsaC/SUA5/YrdC
VRWHSPAAHSQKTLLLHWAGVRVPDQGFAREVCRRAGGALALTSANPSGGTSPLQVRRPALCALPGQVKA